MKWNNLKNYKCPECDGYLRENPLRSQHACFKCEFKISCVLFNKIVNDRYKPKRNPTFEENLEELNNLGRSKFLNI